MSAALSMILALSGVAAAPSVSADARAHATVVLVTEHGFRAVNATHEDRVLVLGDHEGGAVAVAPLPAGTDVFFPLSPGLTRDLWVDVVTLGERGATRTGPVLIDLAVVTAGAPLLLLAAPDHVGAFALSSSGSFVAINAALPTSGPPPVAAATTTCTCSPAAILAHVPVVVPPESTGGSRPPVLDDDPLSVF
jgi:hypothetical protein